MKNEHFTPGKWEHFIQPAKEGLVDTINVGSIRIADLKHLGINETLANANLIAAAPSLYEALKNVNNAIRFLANHGSISKKIAGELYSILMANDNEIYKALSKANPATNVERELQ